MHYFRTSEKLTAHSADCGKLNDCAIVLPGEDDRWLTFEHHSRKERIPFVVYADLECALERREGNEGGRTANTTIVQHHRVHSVAYYTRCSFDDAASAYGSYRGENCVAWFVRELRDLALRAKVVLSAAVPMADLTPDEQETFVSALRCYACERPFEADDVRVRDHCHLTGRFRGPAHLACNLNYKDSYVIPVFFHNLSGYDAHFIIKDVANAYPGSVELLPVTKESYIAFTKTVRDTAEAVAEAEAEATTTTAAATPTGANEEFDEGNEELDEGDEERDGGRNVARSRYVKLRFVDSFKFLGASLEKLASYLDESKLTIARGEFRDLADDDFRLLTRKGVFPYEYVDSVERLRETRLPPRESFYSSLTGDTVSESDYAHAKRVWERFRVETLGDYSDLYLKTDVLLLADVFENFRAACLESYGLDPAYYFTLPGYTWDAMLKHTGVRFELLTDIDMMMFVERGIRGGLSQCSNRYARANNKYMSAHDASRPSKYLMYLDINNLYGWAMCQPLPYERFEWVDDPESLDVMSVTEDSDVGYIVEVDLDYPVDSHDAHADLPFCPTRDKPPGKRQNKLLATLYDKRRYVTHYRNLQQCVCHGLRLARIHRALRFSQSPWLRGYVELNTRLRANASNDFEKNLYKLMNNAVFGKTMENVRNRVDVRLATRWDGRFGAEALISRPNFHSRSVFSENLMAVELRKLEAKIDKPIYVGMSILDISKIRLYAFHYEYMLPLYGDKCRILYTDTDSLVYSVECEDAYEGMKRDIDRFDTSDYADNNPYGMPRANNQENGLEEEEEEEEEADDNEVEETEEESALPPLSAKRFKAKRSRRSNAATSTPVGALDVSPAGERDFARRDLFAGPPVEETFETSDDPLDSSATLETSVRRSLRTPRGRDILRHQLGPLARKYVGALLSGGAPSDFDHVYGVYFADAGTMLGNKRFDIGADDAIFVDGVRYVGTPGLYELIFKRIPDDLKYTERDKVAYRSILLQTNAHRREHNIRMPVLGNKGYKYKHVIAPILQTDSPRKRIGGGRAPPVARVPRAMRLTRDTVDYVHWDDPNELVDRLRLLDASRQAGNNAHDNEILSIIEELREAGEIL